MRYIAVISVSVVTVVQRIEEDGEHNCGFMVEISFEFH